MKIIISPAKKMKEDEDGFDWRDLPLFLDETQVILKFLEKLSVEQLSQRMKCNLTLAQLNYERFQSMDLKQKLTPALFAYEGLQYQYMAAEVFTEEELDYVQQHLRILSGFYGMLKPFDGIRCYRLEMQTKLDLGTCDNLYDYWGEKLVNELYQEDHLVVNLASKEYSKAIEPYLNDERKMITCHFKQRKQGKLVTKATEAKMARGEMVRYMATHQIEDIEKIKQFNLLNYHFSDKESSENEFVFIKE